MAAALDTFMEQVARLESLMVVQVKEYLELFGYETRNKYSLQTPEGLLVGYAAEQQKSIWGFLLRQGLGHWRSFDIYIFDNERKFLARARHPFRFFFQRLEIFDAEDKFLGAIQRRFAILSKRFEVIDRTGQVTMEVASPFWKLWTFPFTRRGQEVGRIEKKWGGIFKEAFLDADTFQVTFSSALGPDERLAMMVAAVYVDLLYFESKAQRN